MHGDVIEGKWIDCFTRAFELCKVREGEVAAIVSETQSRRVLVKLAELALLRLKAQAFHIVIPTPPAGAPVPAGRPGPSGCRHSAPALRPYWAKTRNHQGAFPGHIHRRFDHRGTSPLDRAPGDSCQRYSRVHDQQRASRVARAAGA